MQRPLHIIQPHANIHCPQTASGIENLKMNDSPAKKLNFDALGKENVAHDVLATDSLDIIKPVVDDIKPEEKAAFTVAAAVKAEEANEPLLQENPHRFVLFPIKYHEVCRFRRVTRKVVSRISTDFCS